MAIKVWGMSCIGRCGHAQRILTAGKYVFRDSFKVLKYRFSVRICMRSVVPTLRACMQQRQLGARNLACGERICLKYELLLLQSENE